jgi:anion-transporting  ArsA/GET3 family ATPase
MAMEKLGQLRAEADRTGAWDLIVVDTPPSRSALDFLDAPARLGSFLDGRFIRLLAAPARAGGRAYLKVFSAGVTLATNTMGKILGGQMLTDVQTFVAALDTMFGGFRERADVTYALLKEDTTAFVVVAAPERDALREAAYFVERLRQEGMPLAGLVVNRVQAVPAATLTASRASAAAEQLDEAAAAGSGGEGGTAGGGSGGSGSAGGGSGGEGGGVTEELLRLHAEIAASAERQRALVSRFTTAHPRTAVTEVPAAATDVHDLAGLRAIGDALGA